jgi:N-acetylglucosaminyldiphosphoundecaprenol N-acetyl-beta-D-mannosaminyltransferase
VNELAVLGVRLTAQPYGDAIQRFLEAAVAGTRLRAHFCTVHSLVEAHGNASLREVFASAEMVAMDGMPLVWAARRRGTPEADRVCGPDVMLSLCDQGRSVGLRHFFLGGRAGVPEQLAAQLVARYPGLEVAGTESPPFRALSPDEDAALVERINTAAPHVLWIGLGSPKQEFWAAEYGPRLDAPLLLPVGAAFDFHSGRLRRAPRWMRRLGLEWLFRLAAEPRRLLRRYLVTNSRFIYLLAREEITRRR